MDKDIIKMEFTPAVITADFTSMQKKLDKMLAVYQGLTAEDVSKMDFDDMKLCRKDLNAIIKSVEDGRKGVKREYNKPLADFEAQCKQLLTPANEALQLFKDAIAIEGRNFQLARTAELITDWHGIAGDIAELVDFDTILNPQWLNRTFTVAKADKEMGEIAQKIVADRKTLKEQNLAHHDECDLFYCKSLDLQKTLDYDRQLIEREQAAKNHAEESARIEAEKHERVESVKINQEAEPVVKHWIIEFDATRPQVEKLAVYLSEQGIHGEVRA